MIRVRVLTALTCCAVAAPFAARPGAAQASAPQTSAAHAGATPAKGGLMADLLVDVTDAEGKFVALAKALPEAALDWRPGAGVRSAKEVLAHVTADNYGMPTAVGVAAPAATGITGDPKTTEAFEKRTRTNQQVLADLEASFAYLKKTMTATTEASLATPSKWKGMSNQLVWIATVSHLHEHLGQLIAYARSNKVVPPWSK